MIIVIRTFLLEALKDVMNVFYTIILPLGLFIGLGIYKGTPSYQQQLLSGSLAISVLFGAFFSMGFVIMQQRNRGVYKLLKATPFPIIKYVLSMAFARTIFSLSFSIVVLIIANIFFNITINIISIVLLFLILIVAILCFTGLGFLAANFSRNEVQVSIIANLISMPMIFTSEAFYRMDNAPSWVKTVGRLLPFQYFVESMQALIDNNLAAVWLPLSILIGFTVLIILSASLTFRWDSNMSPFSGIKILNRKQIFERQ